MDSVTIYFGGDGDERRTIESERLNVDITTGGTLKITSVTDLGHTTTGYAHGTWEWYELVSPASRIRPPLVTSTAPKPDVSGT